MKTYSRKDCNWQHTYEEIDGETYCHMKCMACGDIDFCDVFHKKEDEDTDGTRTKKVPT